MILEKSENKTGRFVRSKTELEVSNLLDFFVFEVRTADIRKNVKKKRNSEKP